jgi:prolyl oligopeptidase
MRDVLTFGLTAGFVLLMIALMPAAGLAAEPGAPPATKKLAITDVHHGVEVVDEYRWLEDWSNPDVQAWSAAQNAYARSILDQLPAVTAIRARVSALRKIQTPRLAGIRPAGTALLAFRFQPPQQQSALVVLPTPNAPAQARILVDPNALDPKGGTSIDWYVPSHDGALVAVSLSQGGSERGDVHVYEVASGRVLPDVVTRVNYGTAGGGLAWDGEGKGFYYTRYPRPGERPPADLDFYVQVYYHRLGTAENADRYEIGRDFPRIAEPKLRSSRDGRWVVANVQYGDSGQFEQHLRTPDGSWIRLSRFANQVLDAVFAPGNALYMLSRAGAPRGKIVRLSLRDKPELAAATTFVPEGQAVISFDFWGQPTLLVTPTRLYIVEELGGPQRTAPDRASQLGV